MVAFITIANICTITKWSISNVTDVSRTKLCFVSFLKTNPSILGGSSFGLSSINELDETVQNVLESSTASTRNPCASKSGRGRSRSKSPQKRIEAVPDIGVTKPGETGAGEPT